MTLTWPKPNRSIGFIDALGITGLCGLLIARFVPVAKWIPFWGCPLRKTTGWPCPGCGLTRAADRLSHGNLLGALEANPLGTLAGLSFALAALLALLHLAFKLPVPEVSFSPKEWRVLRVALVIALLLNWAFVVVRTRFPELL
ncbi:MAG: DUF2752 domain-containing protein [Myxococcota bacterium]